MYITHKYFNIGISDETPTDNYLIPIFSVPLLHLRIDNWENKKEKLYELYNQVFTNPEIFKTFSDCPFDVETDYHHNFNTECDTQKSNLSDDVSEIFVDELDFISEVFEMDVNVKNSWFERASTAKFHTVHNHGNNGFSCVVFMKYCHEKHTPTVFLDPITASNGPLSPQMQEPPGIKEGSMIVFPSYLYHFTNPNTSDSERIILSFNLSADWTMGKFE